MMSWFWSTVTTTSSSTDLDSEDTSNFVNDYTSESSKETFNTLRHHHHPPKVPTKNIDLITSSIPKASSTLFDPLKTIADISADDLRSFDPTEGFLKFFGTKKSSHDNPLLHSVLPQTSSVEENSFHHYSQQLDETALSTLDDFHNKNLPFDNSNNFDPMGNLENLISESYKFIRMADDLHDVARYLNDMRLCFIALTVTCYIILVLYGITLCVRRSRRNNAANSRRPRWDYQVEAQPEYRSHNDDQSNTGTVPTQNFMSRNSRSTAPTFMRHGMSMNHSQQTTRLMTDLDGTVKHQLPKISSVNETNSTDTEHETKSGKTNEKRNGVMDI